MSVSNWLIMLNFFRLKKSALISLSIIASLFLSQSLVAGGGYQRRRGHVQVKRAGDMGQYIVPIAAAMITLAHRDFDGVKAYVGSFSTTMATAYVLKPIVNAKRPVKGSMSFPSGHTASAVGGAAYVQMRYGLLYGLPCYLYAVYVGFSRIYAQKHWFRDVLGATTIAVAANAFFTKPLLNKYHFIPVLERDRAGICVRWEW